MTTFVFNIVFRMLSALPLSVLHRLGALLGRLTYVVSRQYAARMRENLQHAGFSLEGKLLPEVIAEAGKSIAELPWIWGRPYEEVLGAVLECRGMEHVEAAQAQGRGTIILTPHLGCFEIAGLYVARYMPFTMLYRQPKLRWLEGVMCKGRERGQAKLAKADLSGVRLLYKALKRGEAIGLLPDQVPSGGEGEWADFFGRPAYTMTLVGRLAQASNAAILLVSAERRVNGYVISFEPLQLDFSQPVPRQINIALEKVIRACPAQYLWSYNRYKVARGIKILDHTPKVGL
ncbi:lysophospholipid acyltransferase family protein [Gallionella capsiferriformans]|uniref:Lipid A biosynthesis acyltransferase n=1 Tax=Gallionella capsiferriformans (strain ES-2) TaxID=395494 RepID=D9SCQ7_GALCS|nr:lysophospholipid acyltransferase family protein [Gallionella capsiferriformans]ADL56638.1 lipid A biosynthesis acyltransferase [Gallionella capsiferriformans ES-2]